MKEKYPLTGGFTLEGFNDRPKPCIYNCGGEVEPTANANVGLCNKCGERVSWSKYL